MDGRAHKHSACWLARLLACLLWHVHAPLQMHQSDLRERCVIVHGDGLMGLVAPGLVRPGVDRVICTWSTTHRILFFLDWPLLPANLKTTTTRERYFIVAHIIENNNTLGASTVFFSFVRVTMTIAMLLCVVDTLQLKKRTILCIIFPTLLRPLCGMTDYRSIINHYRLLITSRSLAPFTHQACLSEDDELGSAFSGTLTRGLLAGTLVLMKKPSHWDLEKTAFVWHAGLPLLWPFYACAAKHSFLSPESVPNLEEVDKVSGVGLFAAQMHNPRKLIYSSWTPPIGLCTSKSLSAESSGVVTDGRKSFLI